MALFCAAIKWDSISLESFLFLVLSKTFRMRFCLFVAQNIQIIAFTPIFDETSSSFFLICITYVIFCV